MQKSEKWKITGAILCAVLIVAVFTAGYDKLDVIGSGSVTAFQKILNTVPDLVTEQEDTWTLEAPDGTTAFHWSKDYTDTTYDVSLETDLEPFVNAGLDTSLLPEGMVDEDKLIIGKNIDDVSTAEADSALSAYQTFEQSGRELLGFHTSLGHFGINMENAAFEWAQDIEENDKDIVFVIDPQILIDAGVNPEKVEGWNYTTVQMMNGKGKEIEVYKFLKPFDIDS